MSAPRYLQSMQRLVIGDLDRRTYTCSRGDFMDKLLGKFDINYGEILKTLKESGVYRSQHWRGLARVSEGHEARYYISLAKACNAINSHQVVVGAANILGENGSVDGVWMHRNESLTDSACRNYPQTRPGISYVGNDEYAALRECASGLVANCPTLPYAGQSKGKLESQLELDLPNERLEPDAPSVSKEEGYTYDRFCENSLLFVDEKLFLFYCDRSGLLCTVNDPIYIHENPLELIRVISSFALMSPSKLGWDTTMKLVTSKITIPRYSFDSEIPLDLLPHDTEEINWEITLGTHVYRTVECIYKPWYEVMIGTATLVWKGFCVEGDNVESSHAQQVPVQEGVLNEYELYKIGYEDHEDLISHHVVQEGINTIVDFRQGLEGPKTSDIKNYFSEAPCEFRPRITVASRLWQEDSLDTIPRAQCRLVMPFQYRLAWNFESIRELLTAFFEAICDYEKLYNKGICHRNICPFNIIIHPNTGEGRLIGLDYAKYDQKYEPKTIAETVHEDESKLLIAQALIQRPVPYVGSIADDLAWSLASMPTISDELRAALTLMILRTWREEELTEMGEPVNFSPALGLADLDLPISAQTLVAPNFQKRSPTVNFIRTSLIYICLTREGPGGRTIHDLTSTTDACSTHRVRKFKVVEQAISKLFAHDPRDTRIGKGNFIRSRENRESILALFNEYFEPLKPLIHNWGMYFITPTRWATLGARLGTLHPRYDTLDARFGHTGTLSRALVAREYISRTSRPSRRSGLSAKVMTLAPTPKRLQTPFVNKTLPKCRRGLKVANSARRQRATDRVFGNQAVLLIQISTQFAVDVHSNGNFSQTLDNPLTTHPLTRQLTLAR
ncbi:hypothetical protein CPC08DRAFT_727579 [Agrocybe pediades]|nr:hypothetical protein CPC08DRAFT_727579 [Agrocybe pediades]